MKAVCLTSNHQCQYQFKPIEKSLLDISLKQFEFNHINSKYGFGSLYGDVIIKFFTGINNDG